LNWIVAEVADEKSRNELFSRPRTSTKSGPTPTTPVTPVTATPPTTAGSPTTAPASAAAAAAPVASPEKTGIKAISLDSFKLKPKINFKASPLAFKTKAAEKDAGGSAAKKSAGGDESAEKSELLAGGKVRDSLLNDDDDMEVDIDAQLDSVLGNIDVTQEEVLFEDVDGEPLKLLFMLFHFQNVFFALLSDRILEFQEDPIVKQALAKGVDLRDYTKHVEAELHQIEQSSIQDCEYFFFFFFSFSSFLFLPDSLEFHAHRH